MVKAIKEKLGEHGYLLDVYLSVMFEGLKAVSAETAFDESNSDCNKFWCQMQSWVEGNQDAQNLTDSQIPHLPYRDELAKLSYLLATQSDHHSEEMLRGFWGGAKCRHRRETFDIVEVRQLYLEIGERIEDFVLLEKMNRELVRSFRIVMPVQVYMQRTADHVLADLLYRDRESSKQVFSC